MSTAGPPERPEWAGPSVWTALPQRFDHYRPLIERTKLEIRGINQSRRGNTVPATIVTLEMKAARSFGSHRRRHKRLWQSVEKAILETFRAGDIKLSDGRSALVLLPRADRDAAVRQVDRLRDRLRTRLQTGLRAESPDGCLAIGVVVAPQQYHKPCAGHDAEVSAARAVYELSGPQRDAGGVSSVLGRAFRRAVDVVAATVGITIVAPLLIVIGVLIKLSSPGPILFLQRRVGRNGEMFTMLKFRTMHMGADDQPHRSYMREYVRGSKRPPQSEGEASPIFKLTNDKRIFSVGSLLRRWSLDELPQLFNVLSGDMSLVGPRPSVHYELEDYQPWHRERLKVRPGVTGLWQIYGRGRTTFDEMVRLDIQYIRRQSIALDLKLLVLTGPAVAGRAGAG
jgi:lipopolysaccharide/colanic/teichoic acid biosynthesis glycosyltransferase